MAPKKQSEEERLRKKRESEKKRQLRIKNNPQLLELEKEKRHQKYINRIKKKQLKPIEEQSSREKRQTRKKWRQSSKTYRDNKTAAKAQKDFLEANSPPSSDIELERPTRTSNDGRKTSGRKKLIRNKTKAYRNLMVVKEKLKKAEARAERYKKRYARMLKKQNVNTSNISDLTPNSKVEHILMGQRVTENVRKKLVFGELIHSQIKKSSKSLNFKGKELLRNCFDKNALCKYKVKKAFERLLGVNRAKLNSKYKLNHCKFGSDILEFLERDENSRLCPGKKDTKTCKKDKRQKRYLCKSLKTLHKEFLNEASYKITYSLFCRFKPFWILIPTVQERDTCLCKTHNNMEMLVCRLHSIKVIEHSKPEQLVNSLCCLPEKKEQCLFRHCDDCQNKMITYSEFSVTDTISFNKWVTEKEIKVIKGSEKVVQKSTKKTINCTVGDAVDELDKTIHKFMAHVGNVKHQHKAVREKKENLRDNETIVHVDFSENFSGKFAREIQSVHFGSSRIQLSLHTGVFYVKTSKPVSFCTVSESKDHGSAAIWAHLRPVLEYIKENFSEIDTIHFISDSPSGQYRNKTMFCLLQNYLVKIIPNIKNATWNYSEAGHGKGAPDGIGGLLKRTADNNIALGLDIMDINSFMCLIREKCPNILLWQINLDDIERVLIEISTCKEIKAVTGTMKVHQVSCTIKNAVGDKIDYRSLSCWNCKFGEKCSHYTITQNIKKNQGRSRKLFEEQEESTNNKELKEESTNEESDGANNDFKKFSDPKKGDYVVAKFQGKRDLRYYVAIIDDQQQCSDGLAVSCGRSIECGKNLFKWPEPADLCIIDYDQISLRLTMPNFKYKNDRLVSFSFSKNDYEKMKNLNLF